MILKNRQIIWFAVFSNLFFLSCGNNRNGLDDSTTYSINIGEFSNLNSAKDFRIRLNRSIADSARIEKFNDKLYKVLLGKYKSSYGAGKNAYNLNSKSLIGSYFIVKDRIETLDEFRNILFVARYLGRPSIFSLDIISKQTELIWSSQGEDVVSLNVSADRESAFITTAAAFSEKRNIPFIHGIDLFQLKREENEINNLGSFGNGVQLYTYWENKDTFKINVTSLDTTDSKKVNQNIYAFDLLGKKQKVSQREFNLIHTGFPLPPNRVPQYASPNNRFQFRQINSNGDNDFYLKDVQERSEVLIASSKRKVQDARWADDSNYLFIITENSVLPYSPRKTQPTGELIVIDAVQKKQIAVFNAFKYGNLLVQGNFLIFDERLNDLSRINIFDFVRNKIYYRLVITGGCGLNNLPM